MPSYLLEQSLSPVLYKMLKSMINVYHRSPEAKVKTYLLRGGTIGKYKKSLLFVGLILKG